jgi:hypothetical protein
VVAPPGAKEVILKPWSSSWSWEAHTKAVEAHLERSRLTLEPWSFPWSHGVSPGAMEALPEDEKAHLGAMELTLKLWRFTMERTYYRCIQCNFCVLQ